MPITAQAGWDWRSRKVAPLLLLAAFAAACCAGLGYNSWGLHKLWNALPSHRGAAEFWDLEHYLHIATQGYDNDQVVAFYPLWPLLVRLLSGNAPEPQMFHWLTATSAVLFVVGIFFLYSFLSTRWEGNLPFMVVLAYVVSPVSIFHILGYTESLFSLLCVPFFVLLSKVPPRGYKNLTLLIFNAAALSLTRNILPQAIFAGLATLATQAWFAHQQGKGASTNTVRRCLGVMVGAFLGYTLYGAFCAWRLGDFLAPFSAQRYWHRQWGWHLNLLFYPVTEFPWDATALYAPMLAVGLAAWFLTRRPGWVSPEVERLAQDDLFWLCAYLALAHCGIVLFTQTELGSLGRYVFGVPFIYVCLGDVGSALPSRFMRVALTVLCVVSVGEMVSCWDQFGLNKWFG